VTATYTVECDYDGLTYSWVGLTREEANSVTDGKSRTLVEMVKLVGQPITDFVLIPPPADSDVAWLTAKARPDGTNIWFRLEIRDRERALRLARYWTAVRIDPPDVNGLVWAFVTRRGMDICGL
jgi:hypothetical protein